MKYKKYDAKNIHMINDLKGVDIDERILDEIRIVGNILPFKTNNYVVRHLISWDENYRDDPIFRLNFPVKEMLSSRRFKKISDAINSEDEELKNKVIKQIRKELNPHPAGQHKNIPKINDVSLGGMQHKYRETVLFFPKHGQTCHAFCTFCFRWPQFTRDLTHKFAMDEVELLIDYLQEHPEVTDVLFTGGDPMIMSPRLIKTYIQTLSESVPKLKNIRIGSKSLSYWPFKYTEDKGSSEILDIFKTITQDNGKHLSFMAHFNHTHELQTPVLEEAVHNIYAQGVQIRTQSPLMNHINNDPQVWREMWQKQTYLGMIPYYMFVARDTGAQDYFAVSLERAWDIFREAYRSIGGLSKTVRGPSMSTDPGKIEILGISEVLGQKVFVMRFIQARDPFWINKPFFAQYDPTARWITDLKPMTGESFFFSQYQQNQLIESKQSFFDLTNMVHNNYVLTEEGGD